MPAVDKKQDDVPDPKPTKGIRIATRCATIEQFVETYHQVCEDSAIFIPNTQRPIKTVMQFRFDLHDGIPALLGIGTVVEELTTKHNRFDHVGIVVEVQRLSRPSAITFDQMLAARTRKAKLVAPTPVYPRAMTVPIEVVRAPKPERMTAEHQPLRQAIPRPIAVPSSNTPSLPRTKSVVGLPTLAKKRTHTVRIPAITLPTPKQPEAVPTERLTPVTIQLAEPPPVEPKMPAVLAPCVPSSIDDGWDDAEPVPVQAAVAAVPVATVTTVAAVPVATVTAVTTVAAVTVVATVTEIPTAATTTTGIVEDSIDVDLNSVPVAQETTVVLEGHARIGTPAVTAIESLVACAADPSPFESVTAVQGPDEFLLALVRGDGRASPAIIEPAAVPSPALALSEPMQPIVEDRLPPAMEPTFAPPTLAPVTFPSMNVPFTPIDAPIAMSAIDPAALAGRVGAVRRVPRRWLAGAFAVLLCATAATAALVVDRSEASVPPSTVAPAHESPLDRAAVSTTPEPAPVVVVEPKKPAIAPAAAKSTPRVRPSSIERPSPRPQPATRPLWRPAPKKCKRLNCL